MFWDSEMYVLPAVLMFHPSLARDMLRYRTDKMSAAQKNAENYQQEGLRCVGLFSLVKSINVLLNNVGEFVVEW